MSDKNLRFTSQVLHAFDLAQEEADKQGLNEINSEHLLLGLMREESSVAGQFLRELGLEAKEVQEFVTREPPFRRDAVIGLMVLATNGDVLYRNPAAQDIINKHNAELSKTLSGLSPEGETNIDIDDQSYLATTAPQPGGKTIVILQAVTYDERARKDFEEIARSVAHDLKSPVTSIKGWAQLIQLVALPDGKEQGFGQKIIAAADNLREMMDQILAWAIDKDTAKTDFRPRDLKMVVDRAVADLREAAISKSVQVRFDFPIETCAVSGDENFLYHMVINLLSNAIKYSPDDKEVSIELSRTATEIRLCVRNQFQGITEDYIQRIERYFRDIEAKMTGRSGPFGLAVIRRVITRHGGTVTVKSGPDGSIEFIVVLPALKQEYTR